jgi:phytoene desaturase
MPEYDVIVVGAGCGGLTAGAILSERGWKVLVVEQAQRVGGCCSTFVKDGFHFDVGATILEIIDPIEAAFRLLGTTLEREVRLSTCDPIYNVIFKDGTSFTVPLSLEETSEVLSLIAPGDLAGWHAYSARMSEFIETALEGFFVSPARGIADMLRMLAKTPRLLRFPDLFASSYQAVLEKYFKDDAVRQSMSYQSFYCGLPPGLAPDVFAMFPFSEHRGLYYPEGGMIQIPEALRRRGEGEGMEVILDRRVSRIMVSGGKARGVELADGTEIASRVVLSDINAKTLYLELVGEKHLHALARRGIRSYELSVSAPVLHLGVDYRPPLDAHHSLLAVPMETLNDYWWNNYRKGSLPDESSSALSAAPRSATLPWRRKAAIP